MGQETINRRTAPESSNTTTLREILLEDEWRKVRVVQNEFEILEIVNHYRPNSHSKAVSKVSLSRSYVRRSKEMRKYFYELSITTRKISLHFNGADLQGNRKKK